MLSAMATETRDAPQCPETTDIARTAGREESAIRAFHKPGDGYGLRNIRERLQGYFGDAARLSVGRDGALGLTVVSVEMPRTAQAVEAAP